MIRVDKYSFSKLKCFLECKYGFYERYFEKPEKENPFLVTGHGMSEFGSFVHDILERYEKGELEIYEMLPYYERNFDKNVKSDFVLKMSEDFSKDFRNLYYKSGEKYLGDFSGFDGIKVLEAEYYFEEVIKNFIFVGKIDLIAEDDNDNLIVIDHKSKSSFKNKKELHEYARQLYLYSFAVRKKYHKFPTKLMFNMFRKEEWVTIDFSIKDYVEALKWSIDLVEEIESTIEFPSNPDTFYCWNFCSYRNANLEECHKQG